MASHGDDNPGSGFGGPRYPGTFLLALREAIAKLKWQATMWRPNVVECVDADGWQWAPGFDRVRLCGPACDRVRTDPDGAVSISVGCATIEVPF